MPAHGPSCNRQSASSSATIPHGADSFSTIDYANAYWLAGLSILPIARNGSKTPESRLLPKILDDRSGRMKASWDPLKVQQVSEDDLSRWWDGSEPPGIGVICGAISGGLEVIDFDLEADTLYPQWCALVEQECPGLLDRLSHVRSPRPGYHVWLKCGNIETPGNLKLAKLPKDPTRPHHERERTLIETRGEGGYALAPGCPAECHATGRLYTHFRGRRLYDLGDCSIEERDLLISCARVFNRDLEDEKDHTTTDRKVKQISPQTSSELKPGEDFDRRGPDWSDILGPAGWTLAGGIQSGERRWCRPGKKIGWSATTGHCQGDDGADLLRVFSSNADPFVEGKAYGKFRAYTLLYHNGDFRDSARELGGKGYGAPRFSEEKRTASTKEPSGKTSQATGTPAPETSQEDSLSLTSMDTLTVKPVEWLVPDFVPSGAFTILAGDGGLGKSTLTYHLAAQVTTCRPCLGLEYTPRIPPSTVLIANCEDSPDKVILPRLIAAEADVSRVKVITGVNIAGLQGEELFTLAPSRIELLRKAITSIGNVALLIIDPLSGFLPEQIDDHKDSHVRRVIRPLADMAEETGVAIIGVRHLNKSESGNGGNLVSGSRAYINAARAAFIIGPDPDADDEEDDRRVMVFCKKNLTRRKKGIAFRSVQLTDQEQDAALAHPQVAGNLTPEQQQVLREQLFRLEWLGDTSTTQADVAKARRGGNSDKTSTRQERVQACAAWLTAYLSGGKKDSGEIMEQGKASGYSKDILYDAKDAAGIKASNAGQARGKWFWFLPPDRPFAPTDAGAGPDATPFPD